MGRDPIEALPPAGGRQRRRRRRRAVIDYQPFDGTCLPKKASARAAATLHISLAPGAFLLHVPTRCLLATA